MKAKIYKCANCYGIELEAETLAEGALIADLGLNSTKELRSRTVFVSKDSLSLSVVLGMRSEFNRSSVIKGGAR